MGTIMKKQSNKIELLSPAGDLSRLKTAIAYGADAVYIGGQCYSLRSRASNFTLKDIEEACAFARDYDAKIHVTMNAILHEEDYDGMKEYLDHLSKVGVTAVIVASPAIMKLVKETHPELEVHGSTQLSITNSSAANFYRDAYQLDRVVLARECSLEDVKKITEEASVDTEVFIHGGMCVNYSGRCTLSNRMTLRDANRGGCAQSCRWVYHFFEEDSEKDSMFTMGSKDLCAYAYIPEFIKLGVKSLKIEGRMKTEYYVATITKAYRNYIDAIYEKGELSEEEMAYHAKQILYGENREVFDGFYPKRADENSLITHPTSNVDVNHDFLAKVLEYDDENKKCLVECRNVFEAGEEVEFLSQIAPISSFKVEGVVDEEGMSLERMNNPMKKVWIPVPYPVKEGDFMRRKR